MESMLGSANNNLKARVFGNVISVSIMKNGHLCHDQDVSRTSAAKLEPRSYSGWHNRGWLGIGIG